MTCNADCEKYLKGTKIGKELQERVKSGGDVSFDRITSFEIQETERLACIDEAHTRLYDLTVEEADRYIDKFNRFLENSKKPACPDFQEKVYECMMRNQRDPLRCSSNVEAYSNCVDEAMALSRRHGQICDKSSPIPEKKLSYAEKFERITTCLS